MDRSREVPGAGLLDRLRTVGRLLRDNQILFNTNFRGARAFLRGARRGVQGPSAMYRMHAANSPDKVAVRFGDRSWTFAELDGRVDRLATGLRQRGLGRRDAAVLMMRNRSEFLEVQAAMGRLGGSAVSVSWRSTPAELEYLVNHAEAKAVFVDAELAGTVTAARPKLAARLYVSVAGGREGFESYEQMFAPTADEFHGTEGAVVIYTSGTTGKPKGAVREFPKGLVAAIAAFISETPLRPDDVHLAVCPLYHSTAFGFVGISFVLGNTVVIAEHFDPLDWLATVERERITTSAMVPTMLHRVVSLPAEVRARYDTSSLRAIFSGGAPLSGDLARRFIDAFGPVLFNFYGSTETGLNTLATPEELLRSPGTIGHVLPLNEIRLLDDREREVAAGETGEVFVRNPMLVAGYHRDADATAASMRDGFFSVGDLGHVETKTGLLHLDGRKRDMIISGGVNVYPAEVEAALSSHPLVDECAVVGVPDAEWGERVRAFVVVRGGRELTAGEVVQHCRTLLGGPKVPKEVVFMDELPKNPTGKILKRELRLVSVPQGTG